MLCVYCMQVDQMSDLQDALVCFQQGLFIFISHIYIYTRTCVMLKTTLGMLECFLPTGSREELVLKGVFGSGGCSCLCLLRQNKQSLTPATWTVLT